MEEGHVSEMGSYMELMERRGAFAKLIQTFSGNQRRGSSTPRDKSEKSVEVNRTKLNYEQNKTAVTT